jgi:hypothetical protein
VAEQADEGGAQFVRGPPVAGACRGGDAFEHFPDVGRVEGGAVAGGEDQPGVLPVVPGREPLAGLTFRPGV